MAVCKVNAPRVETLSVSLTGQTGQVNYRKGGLRTSEENRIEMNWNWTCQLQGKTNKQKKQNTKLQGWISHYGAEMFYLALNSSRKIFLSGVTKLMLFWETRVSSQSTFMETVSIIALPNVYAELCWAQILLCLGMRLPENQHTHTLTSRQSHRRLCAHGLWQRSKPWFTRILKLEIWKCWTENAGNMSQCALCKETGRWTEFHLEGKK